MRLREATVRDIDSVVDLIRAMLHDMASYGGRAPREEGRLSVQLRAHAAEVLEKEDHVFLLAVLEEEERPAGVIEASVVSPHAVFQPQPIMHIHSIYVRPGHRREGVGRQLLDAALEWGRGKACAEAQLNVLAENPARELYESAGFEVFELKMRLEL